MTLRNVPYQEDYRSGQDNILIDFFRVSLHEATVYWRAVGYFSSSALEALGTPLGEFIKKGGRIRLITSVELTSEDVMAIEQGLSKQEVCAKRIEQIIDEQFSDQIGDGVARLAALLQIGRLEIQIAVPKHGRGIYHEKVGLFFDETDYVAFSGSANESRNAFENNYECIDVYPSWLAPSRAERKRRHFQRLWEHQDVNADVFSFPIAAANKLIQTAERSRSGIQNSRLQVSNKWRHQEEALQLFVEAERGILNMATGTGKTRTALEIVRKLFEQNLIDTVIISTNGTDLLNQWYGQVLAIRKNAGKLLHVYRHYDTCKETQDFSLAPQNAILLVSRMFLPTALRELSPGAARRTLLIHDEVHRLGSPSHREQLNRLSDPIRFRLGLSATPEREYDQEGNDFIEVHIGPVLMTFGLQEAIERGILAPFRYYPLPYEISDEDRERIAKVFTKRAARAAEGNPMTQEEVWIEIARVYKTSRMKLPIFHDFIKKHLHLLQRCIIFAETQEYGREVADLIHPYRTDFHTYFSDEDSATLQRFARGELQCLITCHRLSEGIDIRSLNTVILFSSARARLETIQRMGRCLRANPDDPGKIANIVDFIRTDDQLPQVTADDERCDWLTALSQVRPNED